MEEDQISVKVRPVPPRASRFDPSKCKSWPTLTERYGQKLKVSNLAGLAIAIARMYPDKVEAVQPAKLRKQESVMQWFDTHWDFISVVLPFFSWADEKGQPFLFK